MMFKLQSILIYLFISTLQLGFVISVDDTNDDSIVLNFEDNIDGKFSSFSKTNIRLSRQATMDLTPSRTVSSTQYQRLIDNHEDYPYYTLKLHYKRGAVQDHVMTSVPMCLVLQAQFEYAVTMYLNENGYVIGLQLITGNSTCALSNINEGKKRNEYDYKVAVRLQLNEAGPQPEIQSFLEKLKRQQEAKMNAQESDNRPFILKYWKYILPVVIVLLLQGVFTGDGGGPGGGGQ